jgi:hypothetical protein
VSGWNGGLIHKLKSLLMIQYWSCVRFIRVIDISFMDERTGGKKRYGEDGKYRNKFNIQQIHPLFMILIPRCGFPVSTRRVFTPGWLQRRPWVPHPGPGMSRAQSTSFMSAGTEGVSLCIPILWHRIMPHMLLLCIICKP